MLGSAFEACCEALLGSAAREERARVIRGSAARVDACWVALLKHAVRLFWVALRAKGERASSGVALRASKI
jgi:hypothetical protein